MALITPVSGFLEIKKAISLAAQLQASDEDWLYKVVECSNGLARIDVYDEDGELVHKGFMC